MLGGTRSLLTFVLGKGLEVVRFSMPLVQCSSLILTSGKETRRCSEVSWLVVFGQGSCLGGCEVRLFFSVNAPFLLLLRSVKILSFMISWEWIRVIGLGVYMAWVASSTFWREWCFSLVRDSCSGCW